jgi:hypothetical protein
VTRQRRVRTRTPLWLSAARRALPGRVWSGAGEVTRKFYRPPGAVDGARVVVGRFLTANVGGVVPERWVLVVTDELGRDHYVNVGEEVWHAHDVGDEITRQDPLVDVST